MPAKFEEMTVEQVYVRTGCEGAVQRGKPRYADRAWTQLHDEMGRRRSSNRRRPSPCSQPGATRRDRSAGNEPGSPQASSVTALG